MARPPLIALLVAVVVGSLAVGACGSSKKSAGTTATTSSSGGVTVPSGTGAGAVNVVLGDTKGLDGPMTLVATPTSVAPGDVKITVKNAGTIDHEMIVLKTDTAFDQLPVVDAGDPPAAVTTGADKIDEADNVGETGEPDLKAGDSRTFTIKGLAAGRYVFACNIAKHYGLGMRAAFTVA